MAASTPLFVISDLDPVWVRVPVYAGDLGTIDTDAGAQVQNLADLGGQEARRAIAVRAPMTADPRSVSADIFFSLSNSRGELRPGERVSVTLFMKESEARPVLPYSSILYDMYGGAWVYTNPSPHRFVRARVEIDYVLDELAVLTHGPPVGTMGVSEGAAELFGTEFGAGK